MRGENCNHRRYIPRLVGPAASGAFDPAEGLTWRESVAGAVEAYGTFDRWHPVWMEVELRPEAR